MNARPFCRISFVKNEDARATRLRPQAKIDIEQSRQSPIPNPQSAISRWLPGRDSNLAVDAHRDVKRFIVLLVFSANISRRQSDKRTRAVSNDTFSTMKAFFSIIVAVAVCIRSVHSVPVHTAANPAKRTPDTAQHSPPNP